nr:unnamed protein product [Digitaria exilis]
MPRVKRALDIGLNALCQGPTEPGKQAGTSRALSSSTAAESIVLLQTGRETFIHTFMLQIAVLSNHLNGRDTHVRQIKIFGPRPNPVPRQPFHFISREFITYSTIR